MIPKASSRWQDWRASVGAWIAGTAASGEGAILSDAEVDRTLEEVRSELERVPSGVQLDARTVAGTSTRGARIGGRQTLDRPEDAFVLNSLATFSTVGRDTYWRGIKLDTRTLERVPPYKLMELMVDVSPEMSRAFSDAMLMVNPGWKLEAFNVGTTTKNARAQKACDDMIATLKGHYGSPNVVFNRFILSMLMRGALFGEVVLAENGRDFVDIATPDPVYVGFRKVFDEVRGTVWHYGQWRSAVFVDMADMPTVRYIPLAPLMGRPEGRSPYNSALFVSLFLMSLLYDLKRVVQQQGYPRIDVAVDFEKLKSQIPQEARSNPIKLKEWADSVIAAVKAVYSRLKPDDTYIHSDAVKVNQPVGALNANSLGMISALIEGLERMATRALLTMPLMMATTDGVSEANANRQWEIYVARIKAFQHLLEDLLEHFFGIGCQAQGIRADLQFRFADLRASEVFRYAQAQLLEVTIARAMYDNGSISADEMAQMTTEKAKADVPAPRDTQATPTVALPTNVQPEPGANRSAMAFVRRLAFELVYGTASGVTERQAPTGAQVDRARNIWHEVAPDETEDLIDAQQRAA